jgi:IS30 family transposase
MITIVKTNDDVCGRSYLIDGDIKEQIDERLKQDWSPKQIQGYFKDVCQQFMASHETIYQYIYRNKNKGRFVKSWREIPIKMSVE